MHHRDERVAKHRSSSIDAPLGRDGDVLALARALPTTAASPDVTRTITALAHAAAAATAAATSVAVPVGTRAVAAAAASSFPP